MRHYKHNRGTWAGLTVPTIAEMLGCNYYQASVLLKKKLVESGKELTLSDIGTLIYDYRTKIKPLNLNDSNMPFGLW